MHGESTNDWWELRMNNRILTTIAGEERAKWFLKNMMCVDPHASWELVNVGEKEWAKPVTPAQVRRKMKVEYCAGSD